MAAVKDTAPAEGISEFVNTYPENHLSRLNPGNAMCKIFHSLQYKLLLCMEFYMRKFVQS